MIPSPYARLTPPDRHHCEMRDHLLVRLILSRIPLDPPPTQNETIKQDIRRACEHLADSLLPVPYEVCDARPVWDAAGLEVLARIEHGDPAGLRPSAWAIWTCHRDWFEASWFRRLGWECVWWLGSAYTRLCPPDPDFGWLGWPGGPSAVERRRCQDYWRRHGR